MLPPVWSCVGAGTCPIPESRRTVEKSILAFRRDEPRPKFERLNQSRVPFPPNCLSVAAREAQPATTQPPDAPASPSRSSGDNASLLNSASLLREQPFALLFAEHECAHRCCFGFFAVGRLDNSNEVAGLRMSETRQLQRRNVMEHLRERDMGVKWQ